MLAFLKSLAQAAVLGAALGTGCGIVIVSVAWLISHEPGQPFEIALPGIAYVGFFSGGKAGVICLPISRFLLLHEAGLKKTLPALMVYTIVGGIAGLAFSSLRVAEVLAIAAFFLGSMSISQYRSSRREGKYYEGW